MPFLRRVAWLFAFCACIFSAWAAPNFTATLDRNVVSVGETVTLTLTFEDLAVGGAPNLPQIPGLTITRVSGPNQAINIINGQRNTRVSWDYMLAPTKPGDFTIPAIQAQIQGKVLNTVPLSLKVLPANVAPGGVDPTIAKLAFLQFHVPKIEMYMGEALPVDVVLYFVAMNGGQMPQIQAEGLSVSQLMEGNRTRTMREGQIYTVLPFKTSARAIRPGKYRLGPVSMVVSIPTPNARRTIFGDVYDWRQVTLTAEAKTINVLALPSENIPPDFTGTVGSFTMNVTAGPTNLAVGDPITLKVQIAGRGQLDNLNLPAQTQWRDFKAYPATAKLQPTDPLNLSGTKVFEQVIIPQNHEIKFLPPFRFSFFDPDAKTYQTLSSPAIPLTVRATASAAPPVLTNTPSGQNAQADDIVHIKPRFEPIGMATPLLQRPAFLAWQAIPVLAWLGLLVARKRREALANNPRRRRQRQVAQFVRDGLKELRAQAEAREPEQFFGTLFRLLQEQLGEKLDLPASAITEAVIDERLRGHGLPEATLGSLHTLFQICNQFRYAPMKSKQELASLIPKLESVLDQLQQWKGVE